MPLVHLVIGLSLVQFFLFGVAVSRARGRYQVPAPATTGNEIFERYLSIVPLSLLIEQVAGLYMPFLAGGSVSFLPPGTARYRGWAARHRGGIKGVLVGADRHPKGQAGKSLRAAGQHGASV